MYVEIKLSVSAVKIVAFKVCIKYLCSKYCCIEGVRLRNYFNSICLISVVQTLGVESKLPNFDQFSQIFCPTPLIVTFRYYIDNGSDSLPYIMS